MVFRSTVLPILGLLTSRKKEYNNKPFETQRNPARHSREGGNPE